MIGIMYVSISKNDNVTKHLKKFTSGSLINLTINLRFSTQDFNKFFIPD